MGIGLQKIRFIMWINLKKRHFPNFNTISKPFGPFNCLAVLYFHFGLSPNNCALTM